MSKKVALHNLGCKVNAYETEAMQQLLEAAGYEIVPFAPGADIYIINTCTVTNIADRKSRQMLHKAKKMNPNAIVAAAGCYVQTGEEKLQADSCVDIIIGNNQKKNIVEALAEFEEARGQQAHIIKINQTKEYEELSIAKTAEHVRAYIKVQDGCNQFCTYCIIPYARGRVRSREPQQVLEEVRNLAKKGYKEVVLTGIHLSSYGVDFGPDKKETLLSLIQKVHQVDGIQRIRLGSLEPGIVTEEFVQGIAALPKVCPHFHLSLQSGCDSTLERMNRRYRSGEYKERCELLRQHYDNPALTTDVIVGFPGETEKEFQESREFIDGIRFYETHIFKYSRREGTRAAAMENQIQESVKTQRSRDLIELGELHQREYMESFLGKEVEILFEETVNIQGKVCWIGHTREYIRAVAKTDQNLENVIARGTVRGFSTKDTIICEI